MSTPNVPKPLDLAALELLEIQLINAAASLTSVLPGLTSLLSYTPGDATGGATFTRAGARSYVDANGVVQQAASGVLRDHHYIGGVQTTLLEPAATNLILQSNTLSNASWTTAAGVVSAPGRGSNSTTAPDGTVTASLLAFPAVTGANAFSTVGQTPAGQTAAPQVFSMWLRGNLGTEVVWLMSTNDNVTYQRTQCTLTNQWVRYSVVTGSGNNYRVSVGVDLRDGSQSSKPVMNVYGWGGDLKLGSTPSSLIVTTTTSVTCPADVLTIPATPVGATAVPVTAYLKYIDQGAQASADATGKTLFSIGNGTDRFGVAVTSTPDLKLNYRTASTDHLVSDPATVPAFGNTVEVVATVSSGGVATLSHTINGGALSTPATTTVALPAAWGSANIELGSLSGGAGAGIALVAIIFVASVVAMTRARTAAKTPIGIGPDTTPAFLVLSPSTISGAVGDANVQASTVITNAAGSVIPGATTTYSSSDPTVFTVSASGSVHYVAPGTAVLTATSSVPSVNDTTNVTVTAAAANVRSGKYANVQVRAIYRSPGRDNATDRAWVAGHIDDLENTDSNFGNSASWPTQIEVQSYTLLQRPEIDSGAVFTLDGLGGGSWSAGHDDSKTSVACQAYSVAYAAANGLNDELFWLHVQAGDQNAASTISSISPAGVILFANPFAAGPCTSYPYTVGQTVTLTGLSAGNGTYTIASLQKNGVTISGWSAGQLGTAPILVQSKIGTLYLPGDGTTTFANRKVWYNFSEWRHIGYFGNTGARQMHVSRFVQGIAPNGGKPINGALIDEMDSSMVNPTITQSVEYGNTGGASFGSSTVCQYTKDIAQCLQDIRSALPKFYLRANTASFTFANDFAIGVGAGGIHGEQLCNPFAGDTASLDFYISLVNANVDVEFVHGGVWLTAANNGGVTPNPGQFLAHSGSQNAGNYPNVSDRQQMSAYALYLMGSDVKHTNADGTTFHHAIIDLTNSQTVGDIPTSARFTQAFSIDIGQPIQPYVKNAIVTPPTGSNLRIFSRNFSQDGGATLSAIALISYSSGSPTSTNYGDDSLTTFALPAAPAGMGWFMLNRDGTLALGGLGATSVSLRRSEGIIMVASVVGVHVAANGNDTTGDGSVANPYLTLAKGQTVAVAGQPVLGRGGDTFRETVLYTGTNITFGSYGTGRMIVSGADPVGSFSPAGLGTNTYSAAVAVQPLMVFAGTTRLTKGSANNTLTDQQWFWAGGTLYFRNDAGTPALIEASSRVYAFNSNSHTGMKVVNVQVQRTQHTSNGAIYFDGVGTLNNIATTDCLIQDNYTTGVYIHQDSDVGDFSRNTIKNNGQHGIWVAANPTTGSTNQTMNDNVIDACGYRTDPAVNFPSGIIGSVRSGEVARNIVTNCGAGGSGGHAHGIYLSSDLAPGLTLLVHDNSCSGMLNGFGLKVTQSATIWNNKFFNNTGGGANLGPNAGTNDVIILFYRNLIYGCSSLGGAGIDISRSANTGNLSVRGYNNTTYNNSGAVSAGEVNIESSLLVLDWRNNLHYCGTAANAKYLQVATQTGGSVTIDNNAYFGSVNSTPFRYNNVGMSLATWRAQVFASNIDAHAVIVDPKVVSLITPDLTLQGTSPCINAGAVISGITDGFLGAAPDIGYAEKA